MVLVEDVKHDLLLIIAVALVILFVTGLANSSKPTPAEVLLPT